MLLDCPLECRTDCDKICQFPSRNSDKRKRTWLAPCPFAVAKSSEVSLVRESIHGAAITAISDRRLGRDRERVRLDHRISQGAETFVAARGRNRPRGDEVISIG